MKRIITLLALTLCSFQALAELPQCGLDAANEYGVDEKVFESIAILAADTAQPNNGLKNYGPMAIYELALPIAAEGVGESTEKLKTDGCANYRAAAWFLKKGPHAKADDNTWTLVTKYFYGNRKMDSYPRVERVKEIYNSISAKKS